MKKFFNYFFLVHPVFLLERIIKECFVRFVPRSIFFTLLKRNPYKNYHGVRIPLDEKNPSTLQGLIQTYGDFKIMERGTKSKYCGMTEIDVKNFLKKFLKKGDTFFDVGAQFGYFSGVAASFVGYSGSVHVFEPTPFCWGDIDNLQKSNQNYTFFINHVACGDANTEKKLHISVPPHLSSHTLVDSLLEKKGIAELETISVPIITLDTYIFQKNTKPNVIKIDVEGYEFMVLKGLEKFFSSGYAPAIICELTPQAYPILNHSIHDIVSFMKRFKYRIFSSWNHKKEILNYQGENIGHNVIFRVP